MCLRNPQHPTPPPRCPALLLPQPPPTRHAASGGIFQALGIFALSCSAHSTLPALRRCAVAALLLPPLLLFLLLLLMLLLLPSSSHCHFAELS